MAMAAARVVFEDGNPVTQMMADRTSGVIREDVLNEKVLSCIVEITVPLDDTARVLGVVKQICQAAETVISIGVSTVCDKAGNDPIRELLEKEGYHVGWAKVNLGLGRASNASINAAGGAQ